MNQQSSLVETDPPELAMIVGRLRRHLRMSLAIVLSCLALAALAALLWPKSYLSAATLSYDPQMPLTKGGGGLPMTDAQRDAAIDAQLAAVGSLAVAQDVARTVDRAANPRLQSEADRWAATSERRLSREEALARALLDHVKAQRIGQTPTFTVSFSTGSAVQAAQIANDFAASYLAAGVAQKAALTGGSAAQLAARVASLRRAANAAESQLAAFRLANNLVETPDSSALEQEVSALRGQLAEAHGQAAMTGTRSAMADGSTIVGGGSAGSVDTTTVSAVSQQRAAVAADLAALLSRYGDKHPDVIAARDKLSALDAQLAQALHGNRASAVVEARASSARAQALAASVKAAEARLVANVGDDARLLDLQNSALAARLAYQDALKIAADQIAQRALIQPDAQVIAPAVPPLRAASPRIGVLLLGGLVLGLGAAVAAALIRDYWVHTLGSQDDIARWLETDYFAPLPRLAAGMRRPRTRDPVEAVLLDPQSAFADSFRSLGTAALFAARSRDTPGGRVIGVTSALPGEGKTTASLAMARMLAASGMSVAVVDGDPRGGAQIRALAGGVPIDGKPGIDRSGVALFADGAVAMIAALRGNYAVVIVDIGAILAGGASPQLLACVDALVLLARWRATPVRAIRDAMRRITAAGGVVSGVALSMTAERRR